ncbi:MAG: 4Fe-4S binding protein [Spirochaetes bacterium]|nr:4Fe-4S binding protein [Spirochaetota bacterium]
MKRKIIKIDENLCNGCGECIPDCPEGALKLIDGKARLISDLFCDGLGACMGHCPVGAISIEEREAEPYNETRVLLEQIIPKGESTIREHLNHLHSHGETGFLSEALETLKKQNITIPEYKSKPVDSCPGCKTQTISPSTAQSSETAASSSELRQWPVQLHLINPGASYFNDCDLLISADCVPYAYGNFHSDLLKGHKVITLCPKLDHSNDRYIDKLAELFRNNSIKSVTVAVMEVPCCMGTEIITKQALELAKKTIPYRKIVVGIDGTLH